MDGSYDIEEYESARAFVEALRPSSQRWAPTTNAERRRWLFRGVGDSDAWTLLPSAWRPLESNPLAPLMESIGDVEVFLTESNSGNQRPSPKKFESDLARLARRWTRAEDAIVDRFVKAAERAGLNLGEMPRRVAGTQPTIPWSRPFFIAQHSGVPTRYLDWTESPLFAAHFAWSGSRPEAENICVWAYRLDAYAPQRFLGPPISASQPQVLTDSQKEAQALRRAGVPTMSAASFGLNVNPFMRAQRGWLSSLASAENFFVTEGRWPSVEDTAKLRGWTDRLVKLVLPASEIVDLKRLLYREGVDAASLMPSLEGVGRSVVDQASWIEDV